MGSTRRFELGLPLFKGLDLGGLLAAHAKLKGGDPLGINDLVATLGGSGESHTVRKLAALWTATEDELRKAELDPAARAELEERAAMQPFGESMRAAFDFFGGLMGIFGASLASSETTEPSESGAPAMSPDASHSGDS